MSDDPEVQAEPEGDESGGADASLTAAKKQFAKIYEQDFLRRIVEPGYEDYKIKNDQATKVVADDTEQLHKYIVPLMIKFYRKLREDTADASVGAGLTKYLTVLEFYDQKISSLTLTRFPALLTSLHSDRGKCVLM